MEEQRIAGQESGAELLYGEVWRSPHLDFPEIFIPKYSVPWIYNILRKMSQPAVWRRKTVAT
jgi:hypothetical protein